MQLENTSDRKRWARCTAGLGNAGVLILLTFGAPAYLGSDLMWPGGSDNASGAMDSPLTFDAPTWAVAQEEFDEKNTRLGTSVVPPDGQIVLLDDWDYSAIVRGRPQPPKHKGLKHKRPKHKPSKHK